MATNVVLNSGKNYLIQRGFNTGTTAEYGFSWVACGKGAVDPIATDTGVASECSIASGDLGYARVDASGSANTIHNTSIQTVEISGLFDLDNIAKASGSYTEINQVGLYSEETGGTCFGVVRVPTIQKNETNSIKLTLVIALS